MKKLIVVVDGDEIMFTAYEPSAYYEINGYLIVNDKKDDKKLGVFQKWDYWYFPPETNES